MAISRRQFVKRSAAATAALGLPMLASSRVWGANDEIRLATIGCGVRSGTHIAQFGAQKGVRIVAVCDPDQTRVEKTAQGIEKKYGNRPAQFADVRKLLESREIDAVSVATMQYWHALITIWACQAGRHVYVEKPLAHFIWEGRQIVNAARKYDRLVQVGMQSRSRDTDRQTIDYIRCGALGKIQYIVCFANKLRTPIGKRSEPLPIPPTLDYELWCGPARKEPVYRDRLQYDGSFTWNMGDGESCNQGVHEMDVARWLLGETGLPRRVMSVGGRFVFNDAGEVPNTQIIYYDFAAAPVLYEVHNMAAAKAVAAAAKPTKGKKAATVMPNFRGFGVDICVQCEGGYAMLHAGKVFDNQGQSLKTFTGSEDHFGNFIAALRSGKRADLHAEVLEGHLSTNVCHAGNISYRLGHRASPDEVRQQIGNLPQFQEMFDRYLAHLKAHDVPPGESTLGPWLECDSRHECFQDNTEANKLVKGFYRAPFTVPEITA